MCVSFASAHTRKRWAYGWVVGASLPQRGGERVPCQERAGESFFIVTNLVLIRERLVLVLQNRHWASLIWARSKHVWQSQFQFLRSQRSILFGLPKNIHFWWDKYIYLHSHSVCRSINFVHAGKEAFIRCKKSLGRVRIAQRGSTRG